MSVKLCTTEQMISDASGVGMHWGWFPRVIAEAFLESTKDGEIKLSPDPVTMIDGDLTWYNNTTFDQQVWVLVHRAPRSVVAQSPTTVVIHDAWSFRVGESPTADYPSVIQDCFGGRLAVDRGSVAPEEMLYGRFFFDGDDSQTYVPIGVVPVDKLLHFRYLAAVQTPGVWVVPSEFESRWEAHARWTRLVAYGAPVGGS